MVDHKAKCIESFVRLLREGHDPTEIIDYLFANGMPIQQLGELVDGARELIEQQLKEEDDD